MKPAKQPYVEPRLVIYGDIATLTQTNAPTGKKADGGGPAKTRTG